MRELTVVWYPTFRCNLCCAYCASRAMPVDEHGSELSSAEWQDIFLSSPGVLKRIAVTGGEPTLYEGLADALLATEAPVCMDTNLRVPIEDWWQPALTGQIEALNCGLQFHPNHPEAACYWDRLEQFRAMLPQAQVVCCQVVLWRDPEDAREIAKERAEAIGVEYRPLTFDPSFLYKHRYPVQPGRREICAAGFDFAVALPDGAVYRCLGHTYHDISLLGNLKDGWAVLPDAPAPCDQLLCTVCDSATKTSVE